MQLDISIIQYLFESSVALLSFYLLYYWGLKKETFFQLNRMYLLIMPALALTIPLINLEMSTAITEGSLPIFHPVMEEFYAWQESTWAPEEGLKPSIWQISLGDVLYWCYWGGFLFMSIRLLRGQIHLRLLQADERLGHALRHHLGS
ncbi:MAG: hypothetical protein F6K19_44110 [Cyanothece sp. SIO1E1]|nr:hypothetical protein [Cyanothece sp. SIO1E1]